MARRPGGLTKQSRLDQGERIEEHDKVRAVTGRVIGIIGGSGLYRIDGLADVEWRRVESPFGRTSDELCCGTLGDQPVLFLPRDGRGHVLPPSALPFRAHIYALKRSGATRITSFSA